MGKLNYSSSIAQRTAPSTSCLIYTKHGGLIDSIEHDSCWTGRQLLGHHDPTWSGRYLSHRRDRFERCGVHGSNGFECERFRPECFRYDSVPNDSNVADSIASDSERFEFQFGKRFSFESVRAFDKSKAIRCSSNSFWQKRRKYGAHIQIINRETY